MNQSIEALRANPFIQQLVEEWVDNRLTYSQSAFFSGSTTMSPRNTGSP